MIKRLAQSALETYGIMKEDEGFKTIYGYVTRGVEFAFVGVLTCLHVEPQLIYASRETK